MRLCGGGVMKWSMFGLHARSLRTLGCISYEYGVLEHIVRFLYMKDGVYH